MNPRTYDRIANGSILLAVISGLTFQSAGGLRWLVGCLGILAGGVAVTLYFYNQVHPDTDERTKQGSRDKAVGGDAVYEELTLGVESEEVNPEHVRLETFSFLELKCPYPTAHTQAAHLLLTGKYWTDAICNLSHSVPLVYERQGFAEEVIQIVRKLSSEERSLEFVLTRDGNFIIRRGPQTSFPLEERDRTLEERPTFKPTLVKPN